jgi:protein pelota
MRILKREIDKKTHEGWIKVRPEEDEDLWHLYHLIRIGDGIKATAVRYDNEKKARKGHFLMFIFSFLKNKSRVHKETTTGHTTSERVKLTLELRVGESKKQRHQGDHQTHSSL